MNERHTFDTAMRVNYRDSSNSLALILAVFLCLLGGCVVLLSIGLPALGLGSMAVLLAFGLFLDRRPWYPFRVEFRREQDRLLVVRTFLGIQYAALALPAIGPTMLGRCTFRLATGATIDLDVALEVDETTIEVRGGPHADIGVPDDFDRVRTDLMWLLEIPEGPRAG